MDLKLASGETVLKDWKYAHGKFTADRKVTDCNLTVTNKRIVHTVENAVSLSRSEIPLASVTGISAEYRRNRTLLLRLQAVFGAILCIVLIGIPILINALRKLRACLMTIEFKTNDGRGEPMTAGAWGAVDAVKDRPGLIGRLLGFLFPRTAGFKIHVNKEMAKEILDEIGAIVLEYKAKA